jgi:PAS domain S-box-containing protein
MSDALPKMRQRGDALMLFRYQVRLAFILLMLVLGVALVMAYQADPGDIITQGLIVVCMAMTGLLMLLHQWRIARLLTDQIGEKERFLASILSSSVDGIIFVDTDNRIASWNRGAELIFGYTGEEMVGQTFHRLIPSNVDADRELNRIKQVVESVGFIRNYRAQRMTKSGKRITVDVSRTMVYSDRFQPLGSTAIVRDVTDKEEMDKQIYNTEKLASLGTLAAGVAHEINNPLAVILGFTDLLREKSEPGSSEYDDLKIIEENANTAKRIVESMLGFARVTEGPEDVVDVRRCIIRAIDIVKVTLKKDNVSLVIDVPDNLPMVRGDAREFQQVLFNLINNAMAAMAETGGVLTLIAGADDGNVSISVADTGTGIPEKIQGHIFDPFFTTKKIGEGTGLGLSLCYGIVKKYGGTIDFTSAVEENHPERPRGTTFTVSLPAIEPKQEKTEHQGDD